MQANSLSSRLITCLGAALFAPGLIGDGGIGVLLLTTGDLRLLLLHVPLVLMWVLGIAFITRRPLHLAFIAPASIVSPLLLGLFTFPGFGPFTYSMALVLMRYLRYGGAEEAVDAAEQSLGAMAQSLTKPRALDLAIQPLVDVLHDVDM